MPDRYLHGNGEPCPACELRRAAEPWLVTPVPCNQCKGKGRIPIPTMEIIRRATDDARRSYWPAVEARWQACNLVEALQ